MSTTDYSNIEELASILADVLKSNGFTVIAGDTSVTVKANNRWYRVAAERTEIYEDPDD